MTPTYNTRNYLVSYDLNGPFPTHAQIDKHIEAGSALYGRILETVWYVQSAMNVKQLYDYVNSILSANDRLIVVEVGDGWVRNLLVDTPSLQGAWAKAA